MAHRESLDDAVRANIEAALLRSGWRQMTVQAVSHRLVELLEGDGVDPDDGRVWIVGSALAARRWRSFTVAGVARQAIMALDEWHADCARLDAELTSLLG